MKVSVHYKPMIAKLDVWGKNRPSALQLLIKQLCNYQEFYLNINFLIDRTKHGHFQVADVYTAFINQHMETLFPVKIVPMRRSLKWQLTSNENARTAHRNRWSEWIHSTLVWTPTRKFDLYVGEKSTRLKWNKNELWRSYSWKRLVAHEHVCNPLDDGF